MKRISPQEKAYTLEVLLQRTKFPNTSFYLINSRLSLCALAKIILNCIKEKKAERKSYSMHCPSDLVKFK